MTAPDVPSETDGIRPFDVVASVVVLFVLAVSQPLLDLLGRNAEFFLARAAPAVDIVILAIGLTFIIPLFIALVVLGIQKAHEPTGRVVHGIILAVLAAIFGLQIIELTLIADWPAWIEILLAIGMGTAVAIGFYRHEAVRSIGRYASIAPFAVLGLFLFTSATSRLLLASSALASPSQIAVGNEAPVVMVVFDEFPVASLMDGDGNLETDVYPNFAKLAEDGTWFRNAISVQQQTEEALPAILSGNDALDGKIPTASDYPFTLFTLLADSYDLNVQEAVTNLCPEYACEDSIRSSGPIGERWKTLLSDLRIVAAHLFLPDELTTNLPSISSSWSNFSQGEDADFDINERFRIVAYDSDRRQILSHFIDSIEPRGDEPQLHFLHALVPHRPWDYLPSGQESFPRPTDVPGRTTTGWGDDDWLVDQGYQRHLLMVQYADGFIGDLIRELEDHGMYDDALIVVLSDHGITIRPNTSHARLAAANTVGDIAAIPLFIKTPHQEGGVTDDYRAETIDVLPTIADVLDVAVPWSVDGISLFAEERPVRGVSEISGSKGVITFGVDGSEARAVATRKINHFGTEGPFGLAPLGHSDLLGLEVTTIDVRPSTGTTATVRDRDAYVELDLDAPQLPTWIRGTIAPASSDTGDLVIAVAVNGHIATVTRTFVNDDGDTEYGAMIPPTALLEGSNRIELILVNGQGATRTLYHIDI